MPKIRTQNHQRVKVGTTIVEFFDNIADVSQDVASVLLSLVGDDKQPEYFLVNEVSKPEPKVETQPEPKVETQPEPKAEPKVETQPEPKAEPKVETQPEPKTNKQTAPQQKPFYDKRGYKR